ncbi:Cell division protein kinase [Spraguea lophii 42_110]|uniref:cyclin-dependent kinase n=1 Tax=Spraguea lophii (strain 42_110) TaxID=1358809 RepID=S7XT71_SPRLO|nr:Cell division protein kinase [Spraguea lophii 42_110]
MSRYIQRRYIGAGTYSKVYEALDSESNEIVALKKIKLNEDEGIPSTALREISLMKKLQHPNILKLLDVLHAEYSLTLVFEFIEYDLLEYINEKGDVINCFKQIMEGVNFMHMNSVIHRDLKPQNILVDGRGNVKIADLGLARSIEIEMPYYSSEVVTLWYRSPELLEGAVNYGSEIDIWSIGCILSEMITGKPLFMGNDKKEQLNLIIHFLQENKNKKRKKVVDNLNVNDRLVDIIISCLRRSNERSNAKGILRYMEETLY